MKLDKWQKNLIDYEGNFVLCSGRQSGKSVTVGKKIGKRVREKATTFLIMGPTERQSEALLSKALVYLMDEVPGMVMEGKDRPTKHKVKLTNGGMIYCYPTGDTAKGIRFLTVDVLVAEEAAYIPEQVWDAVTPMLLTREKAETWLLGTPFGKTTNDGEIKYFYARYNDPTFKVFHVDSEKAIKEREICKTWSKGQKENALAHLKSEEERMTKNAFNQEYRGMYVEDLSRFFSDDVINKACTAKYQDVPLINGNYYLGVNIEDMGKEEAQYEILNKHHKGYIQHIQHIPGHKVRPYQAIDRIKDLNGQFKFRHIYLDSEGASSGVFGHLLREDSVKRAMIPLNKAKKDLSRDGKQKTGLLEEDLFNNLLMLMEQKHIALLDDEDVRLSLASIQYEYVGDRLHIFGRHTGIVKGLMRAAWCVNDKRLKLWVR